MPLWFRLYLHWRPLTPPPHFGASPGAWRFLALVNLLALSTVTLLLGALGGLAGLRDGTGGHFNSMALAAVFIAGSIGAASWASARATRLAYQRDAARLDLPSWAAFEAGSRQANPAPLSDGADTFWLRSLSAGLFSVWRPSQEAGKASSGGQPVVTTSAWIGLLGFAAFAWLLPAKAASYGEGLTLIYVLVCAYGAEQTVRRRPLPRDPRAWQVLNGVLVGICVGTQLWTVVADLAGHPASGQGFLLCLLCVVIHVSEALWFEQQRALSLRAAQAESERQLAEARLAALKAQVEPHFVFNTIAHLRRLITVDPLKAQDLADHLADFLRASLGSLRADWTTVDADFKLVGAYLGLVGARLGDRLQVVLHAQPDARPLRIPPLMLLTLVENAVQHGIEPHPAGGRISVSAQRQGLAGAERLMLSVEDAGVGFGQSATGGSGVGLANLRERLRSTYGDRAELTLRAAPGGGVLATINLPAEVA